MRRPFPTRPINPTYPIPTTQSTNTQDLYVGLSPYAAPAVFSLLQAIELNQGVFYPRGGFAQVARALLGLAEASGVEVRFGGTVEEVVVGDGRARGVRLADGEKEERCKLYRRDV